MLMTLLMDIRFRHKRALLLQRLTVEFEDLTTKRKSQFLMCLAAGADWSCASIYVSI